MVGTVVVTSTESESYFAAASHGPFPSSPHRCIQTCSSSLSYILPVALQGDGFLSCSPACLAPADSSFSGFLEKRIPRASSRPSRLLPSLFLSLGSSLRPATLSRLRHFLNQDPCGLFAAAVLPHEVLACSWLCSFYPQWVRSFPLWLLFSPAVGPLFSSRSGSALSSVASIIHHVVLILRLLRLSVDDPFFPQQF